MVTNFASCNAVVTRCSTALTSCDAALALCNAALAQCNAALAQYTASLAQCSFRAVKITNIYLGKVCIADREVSHKPSLTRSVSHVWT
jgi:hypothetical protein